MTNLFDPPQMFDLPLSKGGDLYVDFIYKPLVVDGNGEPTLVDGKKQYVIADYPDGATVALTIDTDTPIVADAVIDGEHAVVLVDKLIAETIPKGKLWRTVITYSDGLDIPMCNGVTARWDGKKQ